MRLEQFFEKFELFADAPNAIGKMRELIVDLAIRGELVPHNPKEVAVRLNMSGESDIHSLPPNWRSGVLGDAITLEYGDNLPAGKRSGSGEYPVYGSNGVVGTHDSFLTKEPAIIVGRKGSAGALNIANGPSWTTDVAYFVRPPSDLDLRFTYYLLSSLRLDELGKGIKPGLSRKEAYVLPVAIPTLAEQKRIVAKVDELMTLCDRLEAQQQERDTRHAALARASLTRFAEAPTPANLNFLFHLSCPIAPSDLRKAILSLAVQGRVVPQVAEKDDGVLEHSPMDAETIPSNDDDWNVPPTWLMVSLTEVADDIVDCPHSTPKWTDKGRICVRTNQFKPGYLDLANPRFVSEETFIERIQRLRPRQDDILYSREGGILGVACRIPAEADICLGQRMMLIRAGQLITSSYLELVLNSPLITSIAARRTTGGAAPRVNVSTVKSYPIPLPPLAEQRRIVTKVDQLMALVDRLETQLATSRASAENLMEAVVAELTTQGCPAYAHSATVRFGDHRAG